MRLQPAVGSQRLSDALDLATLLSELYDVLEVRQREGTIDPNKVLLGQDLIDRAQHGHLRAPEGWRALSLGRVCHAG